MLAAVICACTNVEKRDVSVQACAVMPSGRASACACVCDGKAYVFSGRDQKGTYLNDLWEYDPVNDSWKDLGKSPMKARVNAIMTAYDGKIYAGLGYSALRAYNDSAYQRDWWEYTPQTGVWKRLEDYPTPYTDACTSICMEGKIYSLYGFWHAFSQDLCCYDISSGQWSVIPYHPQRAKYTAGGRGALLDGIFYFGGGFNSHFEHKWYAIELPQDKWTQKADIPGKERAFGACAASREHVYLFGGRCFGGDMTGGEVYDSFLRFSPDKNCWEWCGTMPMGRAENLIAFSIQGKVYFGLGENERGEIINKLYCIEN